MRKGDIIELEIISSGMNGEGVARYEDLVVFIEYALVGEIVRAQVVEVKKSFANARVIKMIKSMPQRIAPFCPVFFSCGGCDMQHIQYQNQLDIKKQNLDNCLSKQLKTKVAIEEVVFGKQQFGYRNKIQVPITWQGDKVVAGYFKKNSHTIVPFGKISDERYGDCPLHSNQMHKLLEIFCNFVKKYSISCYSEAKHVGIVRHFVLRRIEDSYAIVIVINSKSLPYFQELLQSYKNLGIKFSLYLSHNCLNTNVILGKDLTLLYGEKCVGGDILGVKFFVSPLSFMQINDEIRDKIYLRINEIINKTPNAIVIEAYSGIGILSNVMAKSCSKVISIEIVKEAVEDANKICTANNNQSKINNICADAVDAMPKIVEQLQQEKANANNIILVIDPPRKGCDAKVIESILQAQPQKIIYISCNPATLARDLSYLIKDYVFDSVTPYDMFPMTSNLETLVVMSKKQV